MVPIAKEIWEMKYRLRAPGGEAIDQSVEDTFARVAKAAASVEPGSDEDRARWAQKFQDAMSDFGFLPGGRILASAGSNRQVTLFNCFVMDDVPDDLSGIFDSVRKAAQTMQMGGGIGVDFSTLRPRGAKVKSIGADASGPVSFMDVWDSMCSTIMSAGARRGAMMGTLRADHPDIEEFIDAKNKAGRLTNFNLSVLVPDALMTAVKEDKEWDLQFDGEVARTVRARDLWARIMQANFDFAEPGVIFIDRINALNNLSYCETIHATNPCGEQPLPPNGACLLGALNLTVFVKDAFTPQAQLDVASLAERAGIAVRFLDNVIDVSHFPLAEQASEAKAKRRMGLGLTGLADALIMCGESYHSARGRSLAAEWMRTIQETAYLASSKLAAKKGSFPLFDSEAFLRTPMLENLNPEIKEAISQNGLRNGCLTTIAPTGTISLLAGNVSSGIEPVFDFTYERHVLTADGSHRTEQVEDFAHAHYRHHLADQMDGPLPDYFVTAQDLKPADHILMQAAIQRYCDSSISKTVNCPSEIEFEDFQDVYVLAHEMGLKGCTTYRPSQVRGAVLTVTDANGNADQEPPKQAKDEVLTDHVDRSAGRNPDENSPPNTSNSIVYLAKPVERAASLAGKTYKLKWPGSDHALYVTINDVERDGRRCPYEVFINTKSLEHYAWTVALTRMISAVFRRGGDVSFVAEELQAIFDPQGGRWVGGNYVPSLQAAIGEIIENHMRSIGFLPDHVTVQTEPSIHSVHEAVNASAAQSSEGEPSGLAAQPSSSQVSMSNSNSRQCPRCGAGAYVRREGCWSCERCGYSQCE
ncbi:MAG: adenosylcobalamin-dependent ribonucleoside-diphosphate reductase [Filomicrobium sp.]